MRCSRDARRQPGLEKHKPVRSCLLRARATIHALLQPQQVKLSMSEMGNASQTEGRYLTAGVADKDRLPGVEKVVPHPISYLPLLLHLPHAR